MKFMAFDLEEPVPELRKPHVLASLRPWVDVGSVGSLTFRTMERQLQAQTLGKLSRPGIFFDFTRYRPTIYTTPEGERKVTIPNVSARYAQGAGDHDFVFLHLLEPHLNGEGFVTSVVKLLEKLGAERYCLVGGMYDLVPHTKPLLVTGTATGEKTLQEVKGLNVRASTYEGPTSIAAVISQEASKVGIETMGMVAHLPQYAQLEEDHSGRLALLEVLSSMYNLDMDLERIRRRAARQYEEVSSAMNRSPEVKSLVERLEQEYESRSAHGGEDPQLSPEVEDFLNQMGDRFSQN